MNKLTETFRTSDLNSSAYLVTQGCTIFKVEKSPSNKIFFHFLNPTRSEQLSKDYLYGKANVNARAFAEAVQSLKDIIYQEREVRE